MLGDAVAAKKSSGEAKESLEVVDVAQVLARSVQPPAAPTQPAAQQPAAGQQAGQEPQPREPGQQQVAGEP